MKAPAKKTAKPAPKKAGAKAGVKTVLKKAVLKKGAAKKAAPKTQTAQPAASVPASAPEPSAIVLDRLFAVITERRTADPSRSHSARLLSRGMPKVAQKFGEESVECLIEAVAGNRLPLVAESADVLYHLLVMWVAAGVEPSEVWAELTRREGVSGVTEKLSRTGPMGTTKIP